MKLLDLGGLLAAILALVVLTAPPVGAGPLSPETEIDLLQRGLDKLKGDASRVREERDRAQAELKALKARVRRDISRAAIFPTGDGFADRIRIGIQHELQRATTELSLIYPVEFFPANERGGVEVERGGGKVRALFMAPSERLDPDSATLEDLGALQGKMLSRMRSDLIRLLEKLRAMRTSLDRREAALKASTERADAQSRENRSLRERVAELESEVEDLRRRK